MLCNNPNLPSFIHNDVTKQYDMTAIAVVKGGCAGGKGRYKNWNHVRDDHLVGCRLRFGGNQQNNKLIYINVNQYEHQSKIVDENALYCKHCLRNEEIMMRKRI